MLGAILLDNKSLKEVAGMLRAEDFFLDQHKKTFDAMCDLALERLKEGQSDYGIDLVLLTETLETRGELEQAGGAAYISALADTMPRVSNIKHYAKLVIEKARLRRLIHATHNIQQRAYQETEETDAILSSADEQLKQLTGSSNDNPAVVVGFDSLLKRECPAVEYAIEPLLSSRGTGEIFAWRGTGKSYITTQMGTDISTGAPMMFGGHRGGGGHWPISRAYRVLYVYGEMDDSEIQERARSIARMCERRNVPIPSDEQFGTICKDYQKHWRPKISTPRDRKIIEERVFQYGYEGLILDNISTLWPESQERQSERSAILSEWFTDLNQRGIWIIWLHHAGKSGEQRGDSEKEDMLSFVLKLRRPANYKPDEQLRVEVHVEKNRHKCLQPRMLMPFEIQLTKGQHGENEWVTRPAKDAQKEAAFGMFKDKMPQMFVAQEVGVSKATIYRWKADFDQNSNFEFHRGSEE